MKTVTIFGASDNLVEIRGDLPGCDEYDAGGRPIHVGIITISANGKTLDIHPLYYGYWCFGIGSSDAPNFDELPDWPVRRAFGTQKSYSETIEIDVPDTAVVSFVDNDSP